MSSIPEQAAAYIKNKCSIRPSIAIILGSGLGELADGLENSCTIPYTEIPGFPGKMIKGHPGQLKLGMLEGRPVVCMQGRAHTYEGQTEHIKHYIRTLKQLGCESVILTNAAGSLNLAIEPGSLALIKDHINFMFSNPLVGPNDEDFGTRFPALDDAYDTTLHNQFLECAKNINLDLPTGVYCAVLGPSYETAAEIRAFRLLGADLVGMSTVPEVIVARHCGLRVAALSSISNFATGLNQQKHDHLKVIEVAKEASQNLLRLIRYWAKTY